MNMKLLARIPSKFVDEWMSKRGIKDNDPEFAQKLASNKSLMKLDVRNVPAAYQELYMNDMNRRQVLSTIKQFS